MTTTTRSVPVQSGQGESERQGTTICRDLRGGRLLGRLGGGLLGRLRLLTLLAFLGGGRGGLLGEEHGVDVGQHPAVRDGDAGQQLPELLVVADRQQHVPRDDPVPLVVPRRVPRKLEDLKKAGSRRDESGIPRLQRRVGNGWGPLTSAARYSRTAAR
jgi:hypothetical protein